METHRRGSDGRRIFSPEFKREQIGRVVREELPMAELRRELNVGPSLIRRWRHLVDRGSTVAVAAKEDVGPASELREQVSAWIADYNAVAPHSALGVRSPMQYRSEVLDVVPAGA